MVAYCIAQLPQGDLISQQQTQRTSPVKLLHVKAHDPPLELKRNEPELRFLLKLRNNTTYTNFLNTLDDINNQKYKENEEEIKLIAVNV